jgi:starvation-inducible outer membrane lipoprotein
MKRISYLILISILFLTGCSTKSDIPSVEEVQTVIAQTIAANSIAAVVETPQPVGSGVLSTTDAVTGLTVPTITTSATITPTVPSATGTAQVFLATAQAIAATQTTIKQAIMETSIAKEIQLTATLVAMSIDSTDTAISLKATQEVFNINSTATQIAGEILATEMPAYSEIAWKELISYPDKYIGHKLVLGGKVVEIDAPKNFVKIEVDEYDWVDVTMQRPFEDIYIGDSIKVYGIWCGSGVLKITWCMGEAFYQLKPSP